MNIKRVLILIFTISVLSCSQKPQEPVKIAINPWPGYEFLYLAEKLGYFNEVGLNAKLIQLGSLSDAKRAYINGTADGMASTIIETVQVAAQGTKPLRSIMVPDYSNGGDVIVANKTISRVADLKGKTVGCEVTSLGIFILQRALAKSGLDLKDVNIVNIEQSDAEQSILNSTIDAYVTYPPTSIVILKHDQFHTIFTSAEIPNEVIDTISISQTALENNPGLEDKLFQVWGMALSYFENNQDHAVEIMATRENISKEDFLGTLGDLKILNVEEQKALFNHPEKLNQAAKSVCETLVHAKSIEADCESLPDIFL